jgi:hypothetical protein
VIQPVGESLRGKENEKVGRRVWEEVLSELGKSVPEMREILEGLV